MRRTLGNFLRTAGKAVGLNKLFWHIHDMLQEPQSTDVLPDKMADDVFAVFTDSFGNQMELVSGLRNRLKPLWKATVSPSSSSLSVPSKKSMEAKVEGWRRNLSSVECFLNAFSLSFVGKEVLEIGAHDGATAFALALVGAKRVLATDMAAYYTTETPKEGVSEEAAVEKNAHLAQLRDAYTIVVGDQVADRVSFQEDDICSSSVPSQSMDIVVSWQVLEHLTQPQAAFREIARILRPGGISFHEYAGFFHLKGGHAACTLDFPWGHARLNAQDFRRYIDQMRPDEKAVALSFYENKLNRMSLSQLTHFLELEGLRPLSILPFCSRDDLSLVTYEVLSQCSRIYPSAGLIDLIAPRIWVLVKKDDHCIGSVAPPDRK